MARELHGLVALAQEMHFNSAFLVIPYRTMSEQLRLEISAGLAIQDTINLRQLPIAPWAGLGVLAAWAAGALLAGGLALKLRDA